MEGVVEEAVKYDKNGIEIQFLNNPESRNIKVRSVLCARSPRIVG